MILVLTVSSLVVLANIVLILLFRFNFKPQHSSNTLEWPFVTVLIAVRNEEENISNCVESLLSLDYPTSKLEILIGNDDSTDNTQAIINQLAAKNNKISIIEIRPQYEGLVAKSKVLAQLAQYAKGDILAVTDADVIVNRSWLKAMVSPVLKGADAVSGYTEVQGHSWLGKCQTFDWGSNIFLLKVMADIDIPVSALGNNMLIKKEAYEKIGGFETLGPTIVEDLKLSQILSKTTHKIEQLVGQEAIAETKPVTSIKGLVAQRKRWLSGIIKYHPVLSLILIVERLSMLFIPLFYALNYQAAETFTHLWFSLLMVSMFGVEITKVAMIKFKTSQLNISLMIVAPLFIALLNTFALVSLIFNPSIYWKNRKL